eukprot:jgi/Psemu1/52063/gm1.52063_g
MFSFAHPFNNNTFYATSNGYGYARNDDNDNDEFTEDVDMLDETAEPMDYCIWYDEEEDVIMSDPTYGPMELDDDDDDDDVIMSNETYGPMELDDDDDDVIMSDETYGPMELDDDDFIDPDL